MSASGISALLKTLLALVLAVTATACASVQLVSPYDEQIDRGLTELYAETSSFVDRMIALRGQPEGGFTFPANQQFYSDSMGKIDSFIARAEGHQAMGNCPSTRLMARVLTSVPEQVRNQLGTMPEGSCNIVVLRLLKGAFGDLRDLHRAQGAAGIPEQARGPILDGGLGSLFRTAIMIEVAKRQSQGGQ